LRDLLRAHALSSKLPEHVREWQCSAPPQEVSKLLSCLLACLCAQAVLNEIVAAIKHDETQDDEALRVGLPPLVQLVRELWGGSVNADLKVPKCAEVKFPSCRG
jgi:hypothetical protein